MNKLATMLVATVLVIAACSLPAVDKENLSVNQEITQNIRSLDITFFRDYTIYSAGTKENPTALLFDFKGDNYDIAIRFWGTPIDGKELEYAIYRLDEQYKDPEWRFLRFEPRALTVLNKKAERVGYVYTSLDSVLMKRYQDGRVKVDRPMPLPRGGNGNERDAGARR